MKLRDCILPLDEGRFVEPEPATLINSIPHLYGLAQNVKDEEISALARKLLKLVKARVEGPDRG